MEFWRFRLTGRHAWFASRNEATAYHGNVLDFALPYASAPL